MRQRQPAATLRWLVSAYAAALVLTSTQAAAAQDTIDRPVTIYVAGTAGGGIDLYARLVSRHIGRHIPGKPTVTVQLMPGAGGIRAANYLAEQAPRDGTAMTTFASGPILEPLIGARNPGYDMSSFTLHGFIERSPCGRIVILGIGREPATGLDRRLGPCPLGPFPLAPFPAPAHPAWLCCERDQGCR